MTAKCNLKGFRSNTSYDVHYKKWRLIMKIYKWIAVVGILVLGLALSSTNVRALSPETEVLLKLLEKKGIITNEEAQELGQEVKSLKAETKEPAEKHYHSVKGLSERVRKIEDEIKDEDQPWKWAEKVTLSGAVEIEANHESMDFKDPATQDTDTSDLTLATVELGVDVDIAKHVKGHVLFLWQEDDTEPVDVDEGFIIIDGEDRFPFFLNVGKLYVPFGYYESHFISDPMTLGIGETNQSALKVGFVNDWIEICAAAFNGDVDETGADDTIDGYVGSLTVTIPEGMVPNLTLMLGASYISNIADTDGLEGETPGTVCDHVGGFSAFLSASFMDKFFFEAEYLEAMDEFAAGELSFDGGNRFGPKAWNLELAYALTEKLELAVKYEGSDDLGGFMPEQQYGAAVVYSLFENTSLALEYLHAEFANADARDLITTQLAIEF